MLAAPGRLVAPVLDGFKRVRREPVLGGCGLQRQDGLAEQQLLGAVGLTLQFKGARPVGLGGGAELAGGSGPDDDASGEMLRLLAEECDRGELGVLCWKECSSVQLAA